MLQLCVLPFAYASEIYDERAGKYRPVGALLRGAGIYDIWSKKKPVLVFPTGDWSGKKIPYSRDFKLASYFYDPCPVLISDTMSWQQLVSVAKKLGLHGAERKVYVEYGDKGLLWPAGYITPEWLPGIKKQLLEKYPTADVYLNRRHGSPVCIVADEEDIIGGGHT